MVYKVLCITLLACVVVQAAPKLDLKKLPDPSEFFKKVGDAANESFKEKQKAMQDHVDSMLEVGKAVYSHTLQSADTKKVFLKAPFKFGKKVIEIIANKEGKGQLQNPDNEAEVLPTMEELKTSDEQLL